jgi:hypothetical protein
MPRGPKGEKRPAGVIGAAVMVAKIATGEIEGRIFKLRHYPGAGALDYRAASVHSPIGPKVAMPGEPRCEGSRPPA